MEENAYSEAHATRWFNGLENAINSLAEFPGRCPLALESEELGIELRQLLYGKRSAAYRIVFSIRQYAGSDDEIVQVYCIWNGARDKIKPGDLDDT
ncbi:MAG: plasmid stabilization system [Chthonomonadales bacterium]|nr:plasmid stabilization system [Chthonomonadales bacterium]